MDIDTTLGHYRIIEKIGAGGMGVVYRAHDERLDRDVAIKVLPEEVVGDADRLHRFEREAKALAALNHPNIATVFGFESFEIDESNVGAGFIPAQAEAARVLVMELLEGESLRGLISRDSLTTNKAVEYARAIADGLAAAHDKGIVHRDLKPENVFLTKDGRIKILDFGLAKLSLPDTDLTTETPTKTLDTKPGGLIGTVAYMAPERVQGQPADRRSDIFALGVVLYEMLTGHRPFGGSTSVETAAAILKEDPEPISGVSPGISPALATVVSKCLEKRPEDRFSSAHDLSLTLAAVDSAAPGLPVEEQSFIGRRWPHVLAIGVAAVIALLVILPPEALFERRGDEPVEASPPRIAVLPFENLGSPEEEYFADGMTEEITSRLAAVAGLHVISRTSAMHYKGTTKTIREIGEELGVEYVLEGTVRWERGASSNSLVRITPQLIQVANDRHLWSDRFDRSIESIFEVQSDIAMQVVGRLEVDLLEPETAALSAVPTENQAAHDAYLQGLYFLNRPTFVDALRTFDTVRHFEEAVQLDPDFAIAWASLSRAHTKVFSSGHDKSPERAACAKEAAERALEIDPNLPEGHLAMGYFYYGCLRDYEGAKNEYEAVLAIRPDHSEALYLRGLILRRRGLFREALDEFNQAAEIDPMDPQIASPQTVTLRYLRECPEAERSARRLISLSPQTAAGFISLWNALWCQGKIAEMRQVLEEAPFRDPRWDLVWLEQLILERDFEAALATVRQIPESAYQETRGARARGLKFYDECRCSFFLGDLDRAGDSCARALEVLEEMVREGKDPLYFQRRLVMTYSLLGRGEDAVREAEELIAASHSADNVFTARTAKGVYSIALARAGRFDEAIDVLEHLLSGPGGISVQKLRIDPDWDPLRDHPRFQALLEKYEADD
jgi:serine/threonine-protein kinase